MRRSAAFCMMLSGMSLFACKEKKKVMIEEVATMQPPVAEKIKKELTIHGDTRIDNYYWLNDRENPKVIAYLKAENTYMDSITGPSAKLKTKLYEEMKSRIMETDASVPYLKDGYYYYSRYEQGKEYPIYCRKKGSTEAAEEIILRVSQLVTEFPEIVEMDINPLVLHNQGEGAIVLDARIILQG